MKLRTKNYKPKTTYSGWLKFLLRSITNFLFPPLCFGCNEEIEEGLICESCRLLLFTSELDVCRRCGRPCLPDHWVCGRCQIPIALSRVRAVGLYRPPISELIQALKYQQKTALVSILGAALALLLEQDSQLKSAYGICA
ncbi:MAG: double zinc ribbon domain-containing protein, partial [candidate division WOR-3 bacterium]